MPTSTSLLLLSLLSLLPSSLAGTGTVQCPLIFDGRVPAALPAAAFDSYGGGNPFGAEYVKGADLKWSQILRFPPAGSSRFEAAADHKPFEVTLSDRSVFQNQRGFRRAGLQFDGDANTGSRGSRGVVTLHFSVKQDAQRPLNLTHEYLNVWHETSDYSADQIMFQTGTLIDQKGLPKDTFKVLSRSNRQLWSTPIDKTEWQNFALQLDYTKNTVQVYYSKGDAPLEVVLKAVSNNMAGEGQYQLGMLKKPTGTSDVVNSGYQESGIDEGQIYGSVFLEDSSGGCVSL